MNIVMVNRKYLIGGSGLLHQPQKEQTMISTQYLRLLNPVVL